jgi:hypothetical protein
MCCLRGRPGQVAAPVVVLEEDFSVGHEFLVAGSRC